MRCIEPKDYPFACTQHPLPEGVVAWIIFILAFLVVVPLCHASEGAAAGSAADVGESIYRYGLLGSGKPLQASREAGMRIEGGDAACINCHRQSGFGSREGRVIIPPITGRYLFHPRAKTPEDLDLPYVEGMRPDRNPYTDATLARAIRDGVDMDGRTLSYLMPHFSLNDSEMAALIAYLKRLDERRQPGVTDTVLNFATVITPDADPVKRRAMLDVIERYFADRNAVQFAPTPRLRSSSKNAWVNHMFMVNRRWELHVWELTGPASGWEAQLKQHFAREPVLAIVSGIGGSDWKPVHAFCEHQGVPCLFPNVEAPPEHANHDFYSVYFSRGVLLEAGLIADRMIKPESGTKPEAVRQIYRAGDSGEAGAQALAAALKGGGIKVENYVLPRGEPGEGISQALRDISNKRALVLWLRPDDLAALGDFPAAAGAVFVSGLMGGLENSPLPAGWRSHAELTYPFDLPDKRRVPVDYAVGWFAIRHIPVVDERVQVDTYLACSLLSEAVSHMADLFLPDYLIERVQDMLEHRVITGYYPRLSLAPGQRFASKGGYFVHFADQDHRRLIADSGWLVP